MLRLTESEFKAELKKEILLDNLDPCNGFDFGFTIANVPEVYWFSDGQRVGEYNYHYDINFIYKFGISWNEVLEWTGKDDVDDLSRNEMKKAMCNIIDNTDCAHDWYENLTELENLRMKK